MILANTSQGDSLIDKTIEFLSTKGLDFCINLVAAAAIYIAGRWVAKFLVNIVEKMLDKSKVDETLKKFILALAHSALLLVVILAALNKLGINTTVFAAAIAAAGLAIGLALQGSLSNFAAGLMIILFKPFKVGDLVEAGGVLGTVEEVHIFNTTIITLDNIEMIVPNNSITASTITNYDAKPYRRIDLVFGCAYTDDIKAVKAFLEETVNSIDKVLDSPAPQVAVSELGDSSINFVVRPFVKPADYWEVRFALTEKVKLGFDEKGFNIPYPTQDINITQN